MTAWDWLLWASLIVQFAVVVLAIRAYIVTRTRASALLLAACVSLVIARSSWFTIGFGAGFFLGHLDFAQRESVFLWRDHVAVAFELVSLLLFVAALFAFLREHRLHGT